MAPTKIDWEELIGFLFVDGFFVFITIGFLTKDQYILASLGIAGCMIFIDITPKWSIKTIPATFNNIERWGDK